MTDDKKDTGKDIDAWLKAVLPPLSPPDPARVSALIDAAMLRLNDAQQQTPLARRIMRRLGLASWTAYVEPSFRFGLPVAAGLLIGIALGGQQEPPKQISLAGHLSSPSLPWEVE